MTRDVCVLMHRLTKEEDLPAWAVTTLIRIWHEEGLDVEILFGTERFVPARILFLHVDLTVVPDEYLEFAARYPVTINGRVNDIRKSRISRNLVRPGDGYAGKVIVKADLNSAGNSERLLLGRGAALGTVPPRHPFPIRDHNDYRIYDRPEDVPPEYYRHPSLVVERFRPEIEGGLFHSRHYVFLGSVGTAIRFGSSRPIVTAQSKVSSQEVEPHPEVVALPREIGLDYGKIDYTVNGNEVTVFDVNKTPGDTPHPLGPTIAAIRRRRAAAIHEFLRD